MLLTIESPASGVVGKVGMSIGVSAVSEKGKSLYLRRCVTTLRSNPATGFIRNPAMSIDDHG